MFLVGGLLIGLGIGELAGNRQAGALLGLGIGFAGQAVLQKGWPDEWFRRRGTGGQNKED